MLCLPSQCSAVSGGLWKVSLSLLCLIIEHWKLGSFASQAFEHGFSIWIIWLLCSVRAPPTEIQVSCAWQSCAGVNADLVFVGLVGVGALAFRIVAMEQRVCLQLCRFPWQALGLNDQACDGFAILANEAPHGMKYLSHRCIYMD